MLGIDACGRIWREDHRLIREFDRIRLLPDGPFRVAPPDEGVQVSVNYLAQPGCGQFLSGRRLLYVALELVRRVGLWQWVCQQQVQHLCTEIEPMTAGSVGQLLGSFVDVGLCRFLATARYQRFPWEDRVQTTAYSFALGRIATLDLEGAITIFDEPEGPPVERPPRDDSPLAQKRRSPDSFARTSIKGREWVAPTIGYGFKRRPGTEPLKLE